MSGSGFGVRSGRTLPLALAVIVALGLIMTSSAQAAVTSSSVTAPSDPFFGLDQGQAQNVTIAGTSNGTTGDSVDIDCYVSDGSSESSQHSVATGVAVGGGGAFSVSVPLSALVAPGTVNRCRLRAVPAGTTPDSGLSAFPGPRTAVSVLTPTTSGSTEYSYSVTASQLSATNDYGSYGDDGLGRSTLAGGQEAFLGNDFTGEALSDPGRPALQVDGEPAYAPARAHQVNASASGVPSLSVEATQDPSSGDLTIEETDPLVFCVGNPSFADSSNCLAFVSSGVQVRRTITQTDDGHVVYVEDAYSSTSGSAHTVSVLLQNGQEFGTGSQEQGIGYEFPGQSTFAEGTAGESVTVPDTAPASILIQNDNQPDGSTLGGRGAITYAQVPSGPFAFISADSGDSQFADGIFDAPNSFSVPASGSVPVRYAYSTEFTLAAVEADVRSAESRYQDGAELALSSPANGATVSSSPVTVTGSANGTSGVRSVIVNGVAATISGGSFTAAVPLVRGSNAVMAHLTTNEGATADASETIVYSPPPVSSTVPPVSSMVPRARTTAATAVKATQALLTGQVVPGSATTTYHFDYGTTTGYGKRTGTGSLSSSGASSPVSLRVTGLTPATTYHFRLVAASVVGTGDGDGLTFRTARAAARRITFEVKPGTDARAPYVYRISGRLLTPAGVSSRSGCRGRVSIVVRRGNRKLLSRRLKVSGRCRYGTKVSFEAAKLLGSGKLSFSARFLGNASLLPAKRAKTVAARFG